MASSVIWNQRCKPLTADDWKPQNTSYATLENSENGILRTMIQIPAEVYNTSVVLKGTDITWHNNHKYYFREELKPSKTGRFFMIIQNSWKSPSSCNANEWGIMEAINVCNMDQTGGTIYLAYQVDTNNIEAGDTCEIRNALLIDLTQMFGEGNEPETVDEFRQMCLINGIDLTVPQPFTYGTEISWRFDVTSESLLTTRRKILLNEPHIETANGDVGNFKTDMKASLKECKISFEPLQEGSGDPSPTNVRPIKGYNRLTLQKAGKNLCEVYGWSAQNSNTPLLLYISNSYGTTLSNTTGDSVTITQTNFNYSALKSHYVNGYFAIVSRELVLGKKYYISMDVTDVTNNPLNASILDWVTSNPRGSNNSYPKKISGNRVLFLYYHSVHPTSPLRNSNRIEIRICGMSCTISNVMITPVQDEDFDYEDYYGEETVLESPLPGKNIADIYCFSTITNPRVYFNGLHNSGDWALSNTYGTTISTCNYSGPDTSLVITQTHTDDSYVSNSYRNGYFCIGVAGLSFGTKYKLSFKISNIVNNPLNANLTAMRCYSPYNGSGYATVDGDRVIFRVTFNAYLDNGIPDYDKQYLEVRNCGMSFTASEFMITEDDETDQTYEPYQKTMYGGYLDLVNNEFVQEWVGRTLRLSDCDSKNTYNALTLYKYQNVFSKPVIRTSETALCSVAPLLYAESEIQSDHFFTYTNDNKTSMWLYLTNGTDESTAFNIVAKLEEPIHHSLTPQLLKSLRGTNNILTDIPSEVEVKYWTH